MQAAGIQFVGPKGFALFLKRGANSDHAGTWGWPGGRIEDNETPEVAAKREASEEIGFSPEESLQAIDHEENDENSFTTFQHRVDKHFVPDLNDEHSAFAWAPLNDPPQPLHPGVERTLKKMSKSIAQDEAFAFDKASVRRLDRDGRMHVEVTNISKANVCPYLGREIPDYKSLGLDPEKIYQLYRDPAELKKAVPTFNNLPLLSKHVEVNASKPEKEHIIGSTGTDAQFSFPYLRNSMVVWDQPYIDAIENGEQKELSSAYRYRADMTPGEIDGVRFDGVMRDIIGNHVAVVKEGRAGADVVVGDSTEELIMTKHITFSQKAAMVRGAVAVFLGPKMAADAKLPLTSILAGVTAKNYNEMKPAILSGVKKAIKGKTLIAMDEKADGLAALLDALSDVPVADDMDVDEDVSMDLDPEKKEVVTSPEPVKEVVEETIKPEEAKAPSVMDAVKEFLIGKISDEDMAQVEKLCAAGAQDAPPEFEGQPDLKDVTDLPHGKTMPAKDAEPKDKEMKEPITKPAMDAAIASAVAAANATQLGIRVATRDVEPYVGLIALDEKIGCAEDVYRLALDAMKINTQGVHPSALKTILKMQPLPGSRSKDTPRIAADSSVVKNFGERFPGAGRIKLA